MIKTSVDDIRKIKVTLTLQSFVMVFLQYITVQLKCIFKTKNILIVRIIWKKLTVSNY